MLFILKFYNLDNNILDIVWKCFKYYSVTLNII